MSQRAPQGPAWLVLPTYDEAGNIEAFAEAVLAKLPDSARVLIVDDNSPDGTGEIADRLAAAHAAVEVLHRPHKEGLGPAYIAGFRQALAGGAGLVLEMDSDFSHDPAYLPRLLEAGERADLAIGSRYVAGGGVSDWSALRRAISRGGSAYARLVLGVGVRDLTGGFKCFRREVLEAIDLDSIRSRGYAFQIEMTYRAIQRGFSVVEVPIVFRDRQAGQLEDGPLDRRRGRLAGAAAALRREIGLMEQSQAPQPRGGSIWAEAAADPTIRAIVLYALVALGAVVAAYGAIFAGFASYDDEGTVLVTLNAFAHGQPLYTDIFSPYGPFFFEFFGGLSALGGHAFTTDGSRTVTILVWVASSFVLGLACQRLSGRLALGLAGMVTAFAVLYALFPEPMHPHGLLVLLLSCFVLVAVHSPGRRTALLGATAGALLVAALMTKINFGAYAIGGAVLAATLVFEPIDRRRWLRWLLIALVLAVPTVVMWSDLKEGWVRSFIALELLGGGAIVAAAWPLQPRRGEEQGLARPLAARRGGWRRRGDRRDPRPAGARARRRRRPRSK